MPYTGMTAGNAPTLSTRQREERAKILAEEEKVVTLDPLRSSRGQIVENPHVVGGVRGRLEAQTACERDQGEQQPTSAANDYWFGVYQREQAEKAQRELDEQNKQAEIRRREQEQAQAAEQSRQRSVRLIDINMSLGQAPGGAATPAERQKVFEVMQRQFGDELPTGEQAVAILVALRDNTTNAVPDWAAGIVGGRRG